MFKKNNNIDIIKMFREGVSSYIEEHDSKEQDNAGNLRGGNTGMIIDGRVVGTCANQTYLRMKGISYGSETEEERVNKQLMFSGGQINEDDWLEKLKRVWPEDQIKCEEQIPTCWETENKTKVTGRPDIVLLDKAGEPEHGIELKQIMSVNSGYNVLVKGEPQLKHVMQAAHYMWQLNCPFTLAYTCRNNLDMPAWMSFRQMPNPEDEPTGCLGYRYYKLGKYNPKTGKPVKHQITRPEYLDNAGKQGYFAEASKITPFTIGFELKFDEYGTVYFKNTSHSGTGGEFKKTIVTIPAIQAFYEYVSEMTDKSEVAPEAENLDVFGKKLGWKFSQYSSLEDLDPSHFQGKNLGRWASKVKKQFS